MKKLAAVVAGALLAFVVGASPAVSHDCPNQEQRLEKLGTISVPATGKFIASDHFTTSNKAVKIAWLGDNFQQHFLTKVEEPQAETELRISRRKKTSLDAPILAELGSAAETTLASIWELLKKQPNGEGEALVTNGYANIFYVCDSKGVLWTVFVLWRSAGWDVSDSSVESPLGWRGGCRVFSSNS